MKDIIRKVIIETLKDKFYASDIASLLNTDVLVLGTKHLMDEEPYAMYSEKEVEDVKALYYEQKMFKLNMQIYKSTDHPKYPIYYWGNVQVFLTNECLTQLELNELKMRFDILISHLENHSVDKRN